MTRSLPNPKPVPSRKYRYSKRRWRIAVHTVDSVGWLLARAWRTLRPIPTAEPPKRILIIQLDHLGDAVLTSPLIAQLKSAYPEATIDVLASSSNHEVFEANANVDRVRIAHRTWFDRHPTSRGFLRTVWGLGRSLRGSNYDLGIDVRGDILSILVLTIAGIPRRIGWAMGGGAFMLTGVASWIPGRHETHARLALLQPLGITPTRPFRTEIHVSDDDRVTIARRLNEAWPQRKSLRRESYAHVQAGRFDERLPELGGRLPEAPTDSSDEEWFEPGAFMTEAPLLAVHLGAGTAAKRWRIQSWNYVIGRFLEDGWRIILIGGNEDSELARCIGSSDHIRDWTGRLSVAQTAAFLERADLFLGVDSGPAHIAASAGTRSVVLFSGTNVPSQWRPWSRDSLILRNRVSCNPCHRKSCPLADHPCMTGLNPERVYRAARRWWLRSLTPAPIRTLHTH